MDTATHRGRRSQCTSPVLLAGLLLPFLLIGCSRQADVVEPSDQPHALAGRTAPASEVSPDANDGAEPGSDEALDELSAAAGLPQPIQQPLVPKLEIDFEYGTLIEYGPDPVSGARALMIEPIGLPLADALRSLEVSLERAGFHRDVTDQANESALVYRHQDGSVGLEIHLAVQDYALPELAAHPGGSGAVAMRLQRREAGRSH